MNNPDLYEKRSVPLVMITGGIGSGKSVVSRILRLNGYRVYDCDSEAKRIMENDLELIEALIGILGEEAYRQDKNCFTGRRLNREFIAARIFSDAELRGMVNGVVHEAVRKDVARFAKECRNIAFCETAIPVTSHILRNCDEIWVITASESERIERVKVRNGFSEDEIRRRISTQREEFDGFDSGKTVEIENSGDRMLLPQIYGLVSPSATVEDIFLTTI